ncbi:SGNH/GDSL hydrolase family protein [Prescottella defluvii]|uniref:SGNH/GDSL hydrolase family protein n=1 Tax=Prescottella defluvii TaxID=1323361 RepID=UPI000A5C230D|nr:SGNH/GDSL hydrolase family protein [Prescottella defluvii]
MGAALRGAVWLTTAVLAVSLAGGGAAHAGTPVVPAPAAESAPAPGEDLVFVALGDSRASGPRLQPSYPDDCSRSYVNYAGKIAAALEVAEFTDVSCSAARVENILDTPQILPGRNPVQVDSVRPDTDLVTLSVGGNDSNNLPLGILCVAPAPGIDRGCRNDPLTRYVAGSGIERAAVGLDRVLVALTARAPQARIYVIGQGGTIGPRGCWPNIPFSDADAAWYASYFADYNRAFAEVAARHGARVVDIATPALAGGHDACAAPADRWFEGMFSESDAQRLHFTHAGMSAVADRVVADIVADPIGAR